MAGANAETITCPECGAAFPISDALTAHLRQSLHEELQAGFDARLEQEQARLKEEIRRTAEEEMDDLRERLRSSEGQVKDLKKKELDLLRQSKELEEAKADLELTVERTLAKERNKVRAEAIAQASEQYALKIADYEKKIADVNKQLEEAKRKASRGSEQVGGKVQEKMLADELRERFGDDEITEVKTGVKGADVMQVVRTRGGARCGAIYWESKRTQNWQEKWIGKLKDDMQLHGADIGAIVTAALPPDQTERVDQRDGVWVSDLGGAGVLASLLRERLIVVARVTDAMGGQDGLADEVYAYITTGGFVPRVKRAAESLLCMQEELVQERAAMERLWAKREKQIELTFKQVGGVFGDLAGIGASLPPVKTLELPDSDPDTD